MSQVKGKRSPRWALFSGMHIMADDGSSYLRRMRIVETPWFGVFLHHIDSTDNDQDPHDHPWNFVSLVVRGGYTEQVLALDANASYVRRWLTWSFHVMDRRHAHRITELVPGTVTLILHGKRRGSWGFYTPSGFRDWSEYRK